MRIATLASFAALAGCSQGLGVEADLGPRDLTFSFADVAMEEADLAPPPDDLDLPDLRPPGPPQLDFVAARGFPTGNWTTPSRLIDLNGDGRLDAVVQVFKNNAPVVLLGQPGGAFGPPATVATQITVYGIEVADFNGDKKLDLAVSDGKGTEVEVLPGKGDGTFAAGIRSMAGMAPGAVVAADFNLDGKMDLVTATTQGRDIAVLLGKGDGSFAAPISEPTGSNDGSLEVGDLNGDGKPDVVVNYGQTNVATFNGRGDGTLRAVASYNLFPPLYAYGPLHLADLNGDKKLDVVVVGSDTVATMLGKGDGTLGAAVEVNVGKEAFDAAPVDADGDGKLDLLVPGRTANRLRLYRGNGDGTFQPPSTPVAGGSTPGRILLGDVDGDGKLDAVVGNDYGLAVARGDGKAFVGAAIVGGRALPRTGASANLDGDGELDLLFGGQGLDFYYGKGDGTFTLFTNNGSALDIGLGDLDGDKRLDVVTCDGFGAAQIGLNRGRGQLASSGALGAAVQCVALGDVDNDGKLDLVWSDRAQIGVALGDGKGAFGQPQMFNGGVGASDLLLVDVNNNGHIDLVAANPMGGDVTVQGGDGNGNFAAPLHYPVGAQPTVVAAGDLDGDKRPDLVVLDGKYNAAAVSVLLNNGQGAFPAALTTPLPTSVATSLQLADFDGDGHLDVAVGNEGYGMIGVLRGDGTGKLLPIALWATGLGPTGLVAGDWNHDGRVDLAAQVHSSIPSAHVLLNATK